MIEDKKMMTVNKIQNLILESRTKLNANGVIDVLSFDDQIVLIETELRTPYSKGRKFKNKQIKFR